MEKLANGFASKIAKELEFDNEKKEIIAYGTFALLQIIISIIFVLFFGMIFHVAFEALLISFTSAILRKYSGGVHANTPSNCILIGTFVFVGEAIIIAYFWNMTQDFKLNFFLGIVIFSLAYNLIYKLAPVDSIKKPIKKDDKIRRMKKSSIIVLNLYLIIVIGLTLIYLSIGNKNVLLYTECIYAGVIWQTFTLTKQGHSFVRKIDAFLNIFYLKKKGG